MAYYYRDYLAKTLLSTRLLSVISALRKMLANDLTILAYHRVYDINDESDFPFDLDLISASVEEFAWQMEYISKHFTPITFQTLMAHIESGKSLPSRPVIVTFDDGHEDNYRYAFPVLKTLGIPATIFLSTEYIGSTTTFWFDRLAYLLFNAPTNRLTIQDLGLELLLGDISSRRRAVAILLQHLKHVPNRQRLEAQRKIEQAISLEIHPTDLHKSLPLNWAQIREMRDSGIEFGSHSVSHPILTKLDDAELMAELTDSKSTIEQEIGCKICALAYPVGGNHAFDDRVIAAAKAAGYKLGISYLSGVNRLGCLERFALRRLHMERYISRACFQGMLSLPEVFGRA